MAADNSKVPSFVYVLASLSGIGAKSDGNILQHSDYFLQLEGGSGKYLDEGKCLFLKPLSFRYFLRIDLTVLNSRSCNTYDKHFPILASCTWVTCPFLNLYNNYLLSRSHIYTTLKIVGLTFFCTFCSVNHSRNSCYPIYIYHS